MLAAPKHLSVSGLLAPPFDRVPPHRLPELMDAPDCDSARLGQALDTLASVNRWLGGTRLALAQVDGLLRGVAPGRIRVLDVGSGGGDIALALWRHLLDRGWRPSFVLADVHGATLTLAGQRLRKRLGPRERSSFQLARLSGTDLPFPTGAFDVALSCATLHHLEEEAAVRFLAELGRVATRGWAVTDLRRSRVAWSSVRLLAATLWRRRPFPRLDGPASVRRAFTPSELEALLRRAGLEGASVESGPVRMAASGGSGPSGRGAMLSGLRGERCLPA